MSGTDDLRTAIDAAVAPMTLDDGDIERTTTRVMAVLADPELLREVLEATGHEVREGWMMEGRALGGFPERAWEVRNAQRERPVASEVPVWVVVRPRGDAPDV